MGSRSRPTRLKLASVTLSQIEDRLGPGIGSDVLIKPDSGLHSRDRIFPLVRAFWSWIWQVLQSEASCRDVIQQLNALFALSGRPPIDPSSTAYCQARAHIPMPVLEKALHASACSAQGKARPTPLLGSRPIRIVDGSCIRLADTPANREAFPRSTNQFNSQGFPLLKIIVLYCLSSGAVLARACSNITQHELRLFVKLKELFKPKDIIVGDRAYGSYVIAAWLKERQCDLVARLSTIGREVDYRRAKRRLGKEDGIFEWEKSRSKRSTLIEAREWDALPELIEVRIIRTKIRRAGFRSRRLTVMTTLLDPELYPAQEVLDAYLRRWRVEMCLDDLKTSLGMENLRGRTPAMVERELLVYLCAFNLLRWVMACAARQGDVDLSRISFVGALDGFRRWATAMAMAKGKGRRRCVNRMWRSMLATLAQDLVTERPGRREPRAVKKRPKYPYLNKPRSRYVERPSRNHRRRISNAKRKSSS
jgi:hypothetical protein